MARIAEVAGGNLLAGEDVGVVRGVSISGGQGEMDQLGALSGCDVLRGLEEWACEAGR